MTQAAVTLSHAHLWCWGEGGGCWGCQRANVGPKKVFTGPLFCGLPWVSLGRGSWRLDPSDSAWIMSMMGRDTDQTGLNLNHFFKVKCLNWPLPDASRNRTRIKGILRSWISSSLEALGTVSIQGWAMGPRLFAIHSAFHQPPLTNTKSPLLRKSENNVSPFIPFSFASMVLATGSCNCRHHARTMDINFTKGKTFHYEWEDSFN